MGKASVLDLDLPPFKRKASVRLRERELPDSIARREVHRAVLLRQMLLADQLAFIRYFFQKRESVRFAQKWHHIAIARALDAVMFGDVIGGKRITRLAITLPPGFTKTEMLVNFAARTLAYDWLAKIMFISYNAKVARKNSQLVRDLVTMPEFQALFRPRIRHDTSSKDRWLTELPDIDATGFQGNGEFHAAGIDGTITSFRAGRYTPGTYSGFLGIDDPIKPSDAFNKLKRDKVNDLLNTTLRNRLMIRETPMIIVMQRLHTDDPVGFCLTGGTGDYWHHLNIPAEVKKRHIKPGKKYARMYPYAIPVTFPDLMQPGFTWPEKIDKQEMKVIRKGSPFVAAAQYDQEPRLIEGNFIKNKYLQYYSELPDPMHVREIVAIADTALEKNDVNDQTCITVWAKTIHGTAYLLEVKMFREEVPDITKIFKEVWARFTGPARGKYPRMSAMYIEKKASGHGVIQQLAREGVNVRAIERNNDKVSRAVASIPALTAGILLFPAMKVKTQFTENRQWHEAMGELLGFSVDLSHMFDDFCDCVFDAAELFYNGSLKFKDVIQAQSAA